MSRLVDTVFSIFKEGTLTYTVGMFGPLVRGDPMVQGYDF